MASFPSSIDSFAGFIATHTLQADNHAAQHNLEQGAIVAVETKIGTGASTPTSGNFLRGNGVGTSAWAQVGLATADVSGVLPTSNGGTGSSSASTGTGGVVLATSPTTTNEILTGQPTISDFTNAQHGHTGASSGGTLNAANALQSGSVNFANLLSTIFSGQVTTYANPGSAGGTFYYINLGGIKLFWGQATSVNGIAATVSYVVTFPVGFFSTVQCCQALLGPNASFNGQVINIGGNAFTTTSVTINITSPAGTTGTETAQIFVIGT